MTAEISLACVPAPGRAGEDYGVIGPSLVVVVDGVGLPAGGCRHGAAWYARRLAGATLAALVEESVPLADGLARAIDAVAARHRGGCDLTDPATPSAAIGVLRLGADRVDVLSLADVTVAVDSGPAGVRVIVDRHAAARAELVGAGLAGHRIGTQAHAAAMTELLAERAGACNRLDGFWVAAADPDVAYLATVESLPRSGVRRAAVCTDGASWPAERGVWTWPEFLDLLAARGPAGLIATVRALELADPEGLRHPRIKRHDDATAAFVRVLS
jgi:hypothetical protein